MRASANVDVDDKQKHIFRRSRCHIWRRRRRSWLLIIASIALIQPLLLFLIAIRGRRAA